MNADEEDPQYIKVLLKMLNAVDVNTRTCTAPVVPCPFLRFLECSRCFALRSLNPAVANNQGETALHKVVLRGSETAIEQLIKVASTPHHHRGEKSAAYCNIGWSF